MTVRDLPDVEALVVRHLRADRALRDAGVLQVAGPEPPKRARWPSVRVHRSGGTAPIPFWLDGGRVQVDVWGAERGTAAGSASLRAIAARVFAALQEMVGVHDEGVVTGVEETVGRTYLPAGDATVRPRILMEVRVFAHPLP